MPDDRFPKTIEVFLPLLDGVHPIVPADLNDMELVMETLQEILGYDVSPAFGTGTGPKGKNKDVAERLGVFLEDDGALNDIAFVTLETEAGRFNEDVGGLAIPFGKQLSSTDYRIVLQAFTEESAETGGGASRPTLIVPGWIWVENKSRNFVQLAARSMDIFKLQQSSAQKVIVSLLAFGPESTI